MVLGPYYTYCKIHFPSGNEHFCDICLFLNIVHHGRVPFIGQPQTGWCLITTPTLVITVLSPPSQDILVLAIFLVALE